MMNFCAVAHFYDYTRIIRALSMLSQCLNLLYMAFVTVLMPIMGYYYTITSICHIFSTGISF